MANLFGIVSWRTPASSWHSRRPPPAPPPPPLVPATPAAPATLRDQQRRRRLRQRPHGVHGRGRRPTVAVAVAVLAVVGAGPPAPGHHGPGVILRSCVTNDKCDFGGGNLTSSFILPFSFKAIRPLPESPRGSCAGLQLLLEHDGLQRPHPEAEDQVPLPRVPGQPVHRALLPAVPRGAGEGRDQGGGGGAGSSRRRRRRRRRWRILIRKRPQPMMMMTLQPRTTNILSFREARPRWP